jgi:quinol monooxygenase YgiN
MKATDQTLQQIERALRRMSEKFPPSEEASVMTDIHVRVTQETGELMMFDDDDNELTRCVVEQWIDNKDDDFYAQITPIVRRCIEKMKKLTENLGLLKPYSFVLEDDEKEAVTELYVVDDDTVIIDPDLMEGLEEDLDKFLDNLLKEE